jgi:hypothetical protein
MARVQVFDSAIREWIDVHDLALQDKHVSARVIAAGVIVTVRDERIRGNDGVSVQIDPTGRDGAYALETTDVQVNPSQNIMRVRSTDGVQ